MAKKKAIKQEVVNRDTRVKTTYHFIDTEYGVDCLSKETYKKEDKFVLYPFYVDRKNGGAKQGYKEVRSLVFEGFKNKIPAGFRKNASGGYRATQQLKPFMKFIDSNIKAKSIIIARRKKTSFLRKYLTLNYSDLEKIRKQLASLLLGFGEKNRTLVNNYFAQLFPSSFANKREKYSRGTINRVINEYDAVLNNLSADDKSSLLKVFDKLSKTKKDMFEKQALVKTKERIEQKFIEDVIKEFKKKLKQKTIREDKWQDFFKENAWIFSQLFAFPTVLFKDKAFVGGKTIEDKEGKIVDFLYANKLTRNSALIEIKKHTTKLLNKKPYRGKDVFSMDKELSGAINQVLDQKENYSKKFDSLRGDSNIASFNPKCLIIIGKLSSLTKNQIKSFELIRSSLKDIEIITFDELYERIESILSIFKDEED